MATNWPPIVTYPIWPPAEMPTSQLVYSDIISAIRELRSLGYSTANPTASENNSFFKNVRCDEGHPANGIMLVSPLGVRYPFAYCTGATHKSALVLWIVGYDSLGNPCYDLGWNSGAQ